MSRPPEDRRPTPSVSARWLGRALRRAAALAALLVVLGTRAAPAQEVPPWNARPLADGPLVFDTNLGLIQRATEEAIERAMTGLKLPEGSEIRLFSVITHVGYWFVEDRLANYLSSRGYKVYLIEKAKPAAAAATGGASSMADAMKKTTGADGTPGAAAARDSTGTDSTRIVTPPAEDEDDKPVPATSVLGNNAKNQAATPGSPAVAETLNVFPDDIEGLVLSFRVVEFAVTYHDQWRQGFLGQRVVERLAAVDLNCRLVSGDEKNIIWVGNGRSEKLDIVPKSKLDLLEGRTYPFTQPSLPPQSLSRIVEPVLVLGIVAGLVFLFYSNQN